MPGAAGAFYPQGNTSLIAATSVGTTAIAPSAGGIQGMKIDNLSTNNIFVQVGISSTIAAVLPTTLAASPGFFVPYLKSVTISVPPNPYVSACTTAASLSALVAFTPGYGVI